MIHIMLEHEREITFLHRKITQLESDLAALRGEHTKVLKAQKMLKTKVDRRNTQLSEAKAEIERLSTLKDAVEVAIGVPPDGEVHSAVINKLIAAYESAAAKYLNQDDLDRLLDPPERSE